MPGILSSVLRTVRRLLRKAPSVGKVDFGHFRRLTPFSAQFGLDRGKSIRRHYVETFLRTHSADIAGRVLEIGDREYTQAFGGTRVTKSDILHVTPGSPEATIIGDFATGQGIPEAAFDCIILTQTLLCIYDVFAAIRHLHTALAPGGVVLVTVPGISQISRFDMDRWGDFWRFTDASARRLFRDVFGPDGVEVQTFGNVLIACASLQGLSLEEITPEELEYQDPNYQVIIGIRARKLREGKPPRESRGITADIVG